MQVLEPTMRGTFRSGRSGHEGAARTFGYSNAQFKYASPALLSEETNRIKNIVKLLLEHGAEPNVRDNGGRTALMRVFEPLIEIEADNLTTVDEKGAALTAKIKNGTVRVKREPPTEIVDLLRAYGAKE